MINSHGVFCDVELDTLPAGLRMDLQYVMLHNKTIRHESSRAAAVLGPAYLDTMLEKLLRLTFIEGSSTVDGLLRHDRVLGSFAVRASLAYSLGLIAAAAKTDLDLIAKVRNEFAHKVDAQDFSNPEVVNLCSQFKTLEEVAKVDPAVRVLDDRTARQAFLLTLGKLSRHLGDAIDRAAKAGRPSAPEVL